MKKISAAGGKSFLKHEKGERLTMKEAIRAKCYECTGGYDSGREDCGITKCSLHPYMTFNPARLKARIGKPLSDEQKKKMRKGREITIDSTLNRNVPSNGISI